MFTIKLSSVSQQTQSGSMAPTNAQLSKWFLVQFCLDPTENLPDSSQSCCKSWHYLIDCYGYSLSVHGVKGSSVWWWSSRWCLPHVNYAWLCDEYRTSNCLPSHVWYRLTVLLILVLSCILLTDSRMTWSHQMMPCSWKLSSMLLWCGEAFTARVQPDLCTEW